MPKPRGRVQPAGWAWVAAGVLSVVSAAGYTAAVRVGATAPHLPVPAVATVQSTELPRAVGEQQVTIRTIDPPLVPTSVSSKPPARILRNGRAVIVRPVRDVTDVTNLAGPSDVLELDATALGKSTSRATEVDHLTSITVASPTPSTDVEPVPESEAGSEHSSKPGTLLTAVQAELAKLAFVEARHVVPPPLSLRERSSGDIPWLKTKRKLITILAVGVASGYALRRIDFKGAKHQGETLNQRHKDR